MTDHTDCTGPAFSSCTWPRSLLASGALVVLAACGGEGGASTEARAPARTQVAPSASGVASVSPAPAAPAAASVEPDPARPEDAAKVAALLAKKAAVTESSPRFSPDGKRVAFVSTVDGRALYVQDVDGATPPRKVTALSGRFRRPELSPDGTSLYFTSDDHGDEAFRIMSVDLASGAISEETPGEKLRRDHGPHFVKGGDRFLFTARKMEDTGVVVFEQALSRGATPTRLYANPDRHLLDVRRDGKQLALTTPAASDTLFLVELPAGSSQKVFPSWDTAKKPTRVYEAAYSPDGTRVYVATDDGGDKTSLLALDARTGRELARFAETRVPGGAVQGLVTSETTLAYVIDLGTTHELRMLDAKTLRARPEVALPLGSEVPGSRHPNSTSSLALSPDGKRAVLQWSTPSSPPRVYLVDTSTGAATPLTKTPAADGATPIDARVVRIPSFDKLEIPAIVYLPKNAAGKLPVVMSIHGGFPYASNARFDTDVSALLDAGYAVVEPNVRGSSGFGAAYERADDGIRKLEGVRDFGFVGRWIAAQPWADASRIAVMGASAGGYYTLMCLEHYPELWRAGVALVPIYDIPLAYASMDKSLRKFMEERELVPLTETMSIAALSPSSHVDRIRAPLFVYAGARDVRTPTEQIDALVRDVRARHGAVEYMRAGDAGHSRGDPKVDAERLARILRFLGESMK